MEAARVPKAPNRIVRSRPTVPRFNKVDLAGVAVPRHRERQAPIPVASLPNPTIRQYTPPSIKRTDGIQPRRHLISNDRLTPQNAVSRGSASVTVSPQRAQSSQSGLAFQRQRVPSSITVNPSSPRVIPQSTALTDSRRRVSDPVRVPDQTVRVVNDPAVVVPPVNSPQPNSASVTPPRSERRVPHSITSDPSQVIPPQVDQLFQRGNDPSRTPPARLEPKEDRPADVPETTSPSAQGPRTPSTTSRTDTLAKRVTALTSPSDRPNRLNPTRLSGAIRPAEFAIPTMTSAAVSYQRQPASVSTNIPKWTPKPPKAVRVLTVGRL